MGEAAELLLYECEEAVMVQVSGGGEDHALRGEAARVVGVNGVWLKLETVCAVPRMGGRARVVGPELLGEGFMDQVVRIVLIHLDLFKDDALLAGEIGF